jgi:hypothetical protein
MKKECKNLLVECRQLNVRTGVKGGEIIGNRTHCDDSNCATDSWKGMRCNWLGQPFETGWGHKCGVKVS